MKFKLMIVALFATAFALSGCAELQKTASDIGQSAKASAKMRAQMEASQKASEATGKVFGN